MIATSCEDASSSATGSLTDSYVHPLLIRFQPPAFIQRRALVLKTLRSLVPKCRSLLDIGTGEGGLLSYLVNCDDDVPIEQLVGVDPDPEALEDAVNNTKPSEIHQEQLRWRPLEITLLLGGVADMQAEAQTYDCITAIEVIEHLDPPDVEILSEVCLGQLRPRCWIVTTPNRDFNEVFKRIDDDPRHTYTREGVDYRMRHDDHRFEFSRSEFRAWAYQQCDRFAYTVRFTGVGSVENAFSGQKEWQNMFPEGDLDSAFGQSTQAAIFSTSDESRTCSTRSGQRRSSASTSGLQHIITHTYPWSNEDKYPPSAGTTASIVLKCESFFRPTFKSSKDYKAREEELVLVDCKEFYETCFDIQRVARFDFAKFLESLPLLVDQILLPIGSSETSTDVQDADDWQYASDYVPRARLKSARVIKADDWRTCIEFVYDISSFSRDREEDQESISTVSGDWDLPLEEETLPIGDWYHPDEDSISESDQNLAVADSISSACLSTSTGSE